MHRAYRSPSQANCAARAPWRDLTRSAQWRQRKRTPEFYILEEIETHEPFPAAAVADWAIPKDYACHDFSRWNPAL
jgi:hypothetical protein